STFLEILLHTGFATNGRPQSCFLISDPGHGKTELLRRFNQNKNAEVYSDITVQPLMRALKKAQEGVLTHIIIPEFQKVIGRRKDTSQNFLTLLLEAMEEGVDKIAMGPMEVEFGGARLGVLGASTYDSMQKNPYLIDDLAMDSRAFFIDARATREEIISIETAIAMGRTQALAPIKLNIPDHKFDVYVPEKIGRLCQPLVEEMYEAKVPVYGIRTYARFLHVLKGIAIRDGKHKVQLMHFEEMLEFKQLWINVPNIGRAGRGSSFAPNPIHAE
ncbi:MAG: hypothetical protein ACMG51_09615, partial [Ginsengibacter sp.]